MSNDTYTDDVKESVATSKELRMVAFRLGDEMYSADVLLISEVLRGVEITPVPGAPSFVLGIVNLRGKVVTVFDGRSRLGLSPKDMDDMSRVLIMEASGEAVGLLVDSVSEILTLDSSKIDAAPESSTPSGNDFIYGVTSYHDELLIVIDIPRLLASCKVSP